MSLNLITKLPPRHLKITQTMMEDLMFNPTLAAKLIMGIELDVFQSCRIKTLWWTPYVIDSSGFSTGKTYINWIFLQLRSMLIPDHWSLVYYQTFQVMKDSFWSNYQRCNHPMYIAQIGQLARDGEEAAHGKDTKKEPACWKAFFRNGSEIWHPAPGFLSASKSQASRRTNTLLVDEFTKAEAMSLKVSGIDDQLLGRVTRESFNQNHPIWSNHMVFTGTAENKDHPSYKRYKTFEKKIKAGDPNSALISFSYKDYSNKLSLNGRTFKQNYRIDRTIKEMTCKYTKSKTLQEVFGIWTREGTGLYSDGVYLTAEAMWLQRGCKYLDSRNADPDQKAKYVLGVDSAPAQSRTSDDGALIILRAIRNPDVATSNTMQDWMMNPVWALRLRGATVRQWSGIIHKLHRVWRFERICVDHGAGGGGGFIAAELGKETQEIDGHDTYSRPILTPYSTSAVDGDYSLVMFGHGDKSIQQMWPESSKGYDVLKDYAHYTLHGLLYHAQLALPERWANRSQTKNKNDNNADTHELLASELGRQLGGITIQTTEDGSRVLTSQGARKFITQGRSDFVSALLHCVTGFSVYVHNAQIWDEDEDQDSIGFWSSNQENV